MVVRGKPARPLALSDAMLERLKNQPVIAKLIVVGVVVAAVGGFAKGMYEVWRTFRQISEKPAATATHPETMPSPSISRAPRKPFKEPFALDEHQVSVIWGVVVKVNKVGRVLRSDPEFMAVTRTRRPYFAELSVAPSSENVMEARRVVMSGSQTEWLLTRKDCDSLVLVVTEIEFLPYGPVNPYGVPINSGSSPYTGPADAHGWPINEQSTKAVKGFVAGKCEG